ncbi:Inner membrane protein YdjM [Thermincola ferriacetica]|uniref:Inner membrane protein YdjM n=1 Tax=Thermincola ferriacetica TaxID=281456 RepID=A0A0L6W4A2_9FIRM|nr:metal-dependent hydrolase [Thermincola ferriacetica]KNZ70365.1 Inner membrane protein YdjM [Thermincola ferriacetica]
MLAKTHMRIGLIGTMLVWPEMLKITTKDYSAGIVLAMALAYISSGKRMLTNLLQAAFIMYWTYWLAYEFKEYFTFSAIIAPVVMMFAAAIGSLLPDLDHPNSTITHEVVPEIPVLAGTRIAELIAGATMLAAAWYMGKHPVLPVFQGVLNFILIATGLTVLIFTLAGHRGMTHSLLGLAITSTAAWYIQDAVGIWQRWGVNILPAFVLGYSLHLLADALTNSGVPLLYPYRKRFALPWFNTGSLKERFFSYLMLCTYIILLLYQTGFLNRGFALLAMLEGTGRGW